MLAYLAKELGLDLVIVQEHSIVSAPEMQREELGSSWVFYYTSADTGGNDGVGVLVSPRLRHVVMLQSITARVLRVDVKVAVAERSLLQCVQPDCSPPR